MDYNSENFSIEKVVDFTDKLIKIEKNKVRWIKITGLSEINIIERIGELFHHHPLVLEDILNPNQRPKLEDYGDYIYIVLKMLVWNQEHGVIETEQISFILGSNYLISFLEQESEIFSPIIDRIKLNRGKIRTMKADYLAYALTDVIIDNYFIILEFIGEKIEDLEENLIKNPEPAVLKSIYRLKRNSIEFRKSIWPMRELINKMQREKSNLFSDELQLYTRDLYDHIFRISDLLENYRDIIFGMLDMYLSSVSNRMNEIMKVLTIISTIFIPLSFLASFYGMNFLYMPEFKSPIAYPVLIIVMILIAIIMVFFFRKRKWL
ncbi:MAG: magnesium/cobalt transporter CorA [Promethearchaeota archaeon]